MYTSTPFKVYAMIEMTMQVPDKLAMRIQPFGPWLPTVLELSLVGFKTRAAATATEVISFLETNPTPTAFLDLHVSGQNQTRLRRLLALNEAGMLSEEEQLEMNELEQIEHIIVMLKAKVAGQIQ